jgi:hypothetical protein
MNSTYPVPAGGYKISTNQKTKDITIELSQNFPSQTQTLTLTQEFADNYFPLFTPKGKIIVRNTGKIESFPQELIVSAGILTPAKQNILFGKIPPFGYIEIPVSFNKPPLLTNKSDTIKIAISENYISKKINITPFIFNGWTMIGGIILAIFIIAISAIIIKSGNIPFFKQ